MLPTRRWLRLGLVTPNLSRSAGRSSMTGTETLSSEPTHRMTVQAPAGKLAGMTTINHEFINSLCAPVSSPPSKRVDPEPAVPALDTTFGDPRPELASPR